MKIYNECQLFKSIIEKGYYNKGVFQSKLALKITTQGCILYFN